MSHRSNKRRGVFYLFMSMICLASCTEMFLNSHAHCGWSGNGETDDNSLPYHDVAESTTVTVKDDVTPNIKTGAFRVCRIVFRSQRKDGRLCLMQRHWKIQLCEIRLELFDGRAGINGVERPNVTMNCDRSLTSVEWCTTGRFLTLGVAKEGLQPSMKIIEVEFEIYDIRNKNRQVFMDSLPNCGSKFQLESSEVTVSNLNPHLNTKPLLLCTLTFDYVGLEENKTVCLLFRSGAGRSQCSLPYTLTVYSQLPDSKVYLETLKYGCNLTQPERWCSNGTSLRLDLLRSPSQNETEKPDVFSVLVMDHIGGAESLPSRRESEDQEVPSSQLIQILVPVFAVVFILVVALIGAGVFISKSQKHKGDHKRVPSQEDDSSKRAMIPPGKCPNGEMV